MFYERSVLISCDRFTFCVVVIKKLLCIRSQIFYFSCFHPSTHNHLALTAWYALRRLTGQKQTLHFSRSAANRCVPAVLHATYFCLHSSSPASLRSTSAFPSAIRIVTVKAQDNQFYCNPHFSYLSMAVSAMMLQPFLRTRAIHFCVILLLLLLFCYYNITCTPFVYLITNQAFFSF